MINVFFYLSILTLIAAFHRWLDSQLTAFFSWTKTKLALLTSDPKDPWQSQISALNFLISGIRSGQSLDSCLLMLQRHSDSIEIKEKINRVLCQNPDPDFLSLLLSSSLQTGTKALGNLSDFLQILRAKRRISLKAHALSAQSRAQATTLSCLPLILLMGLCLMDGETFFSAIRSSTFWFLMAISSLFSLVGNLWIKTLLNKCLQPLRREEFVEEIWLPQLILLFLARQSGGCDGLSAIEYAQSKMEPKELAALYPSPLFQQFADSVKRASELGAPLREEVKFFLQDLNSKVEGRWEEKSQRLPVQMMAPLFLCYFPASLLVITAIFFPLVSELL